MSRDKRELDLPAELETQFILRLPEEPAKHLKHILKTDGETIKNRLSIRVDDDMRHGEVKLDNRIMHAKIVDLPTIVESLKTIDNKSFYKTADISQIMICKEEPDTLTSEDESQVKNKKKDHLKVDKKFLFPHGITPPTKNVRKRRFRKTLKKKNVDAPEIEKEVKKLLRADNEADNVTWEIIKDEELKPLKSKTNKPSLTNKTDKKFKDEGHKREKGKRTEPTKFVDIFGGAVSDSDLEENPNTATDGADIDDRHVSTYDALLSETGSMQSYMNLSKVDNLPTEFSSLIFDDPPQGTSKPYQHQEIHNASAEQRKELFTGEDTCHSKDPKNNLVQQIEQARKELDQLKQQKKRTLNEIAEMDNLALQQRFQGILHTLNQDIMYKEMEYQGMITLLNSEDI